MPKFIYSKCQKETKIIPHVCGREDKMANEVIWYEKSHTISKSKKR